jgi:hypothetical protein
MDAAPRIYGVDPMNEQLITFDLACITFDLSYTEEVGGLSSSSPTGKPNPFPVAEEGCCLRKG